MLTELNFDRRPALRPRRSALRVESAPCQMRSDSSRWPFSCARGPTAPAARGNGMQRVTLARAGILFGRGCTRALLRLVGANLLCFVLLFVLYPGGAAVADPEAAGVHASGVPAHPAVPTAVLFNMSATGIGHLTETLFFDRSVRVLGGDFGVDVRGRRIADEVAGRIGPSAALVGVPALLFVLAAALTGLGFVLIAARRSAGGHAIGVLVVVAGVLIFAGQHGLARLFAYLQASGFGPGRLADDGGRLLVVAAVLVGLAVALWWREVGLMPALADAPARAARARGLPEWVVCLNHGAVCALPALRTPAFGSIGFLFLLSLVLETVFEVPGLGRYAVEAFHAGDAIALHSVVLLGVFLHGVGLGLVWMAFARFEAPRSR